MTGLSNPGTGFDCSCRVDNGGGDGYGEGKEVVVDGDVLLM